MKRLSQWIGLGVVVGSLVARTGSAISLPAETVLYMPFEEGAGAKTNDMSGKNNHGTFMGGVKWAKGKFGGGLELNGQDSHVEIASNATLQAGESPFTISFWVQADPASQQWARVVDKFYGTGYCVGRRGGDLVMGAEWSGSPNAFATTTTVFDNKWHHIALTREVKGGNELVIYLNGKEENRANGGAIVQKNLESTPVRIGAGDECCAEGGNAAYYLKGLVDDVLIVKKVLTPAEITGFMNESISLAVQPSGKLAATWANLKER